MHMQWFLCAVSSAHIFFSFIPPNSKRCVLFLTYCSPGAWLLAGKHWIQRNGEMTMERYGRGFTPGFILVVAGEVLKSHLHRRTWRWSFYNSIDSRAHRQQVCKHALVQWAKRLYKHDAHCILAVSASSASRRQNAPVQ